MVVAVNDCVVSWLNHHFFGSLAGAVGVKVIVSVKTKLSWEADFLRACSSDVARRRSVARVKMMVNIKSTPATFATSHSL